MLVKEYSDIVKEILYRFCSSPGRMMEKIEDSEVIFAAIKKEHSETVSLEEIEALSNLVNTLRFNLGPLTGYSNDKYSVAVRDFLMLCDRVVSPKNFEKRVEKPKRNFWIWINCTYSELMGMNERLKAVKRELIA